MKKLNTALVCIISVGIIIMAAMSCFFQEHTLLLYNIRELRKESGAAFICPITETEIMLVTVFAIVILIFNLTIVMHRKKRSILNKIIIGVVTVAGFYVMLFTTIVYLFVDGGDKFFCFYSPDEKQSIIAYEISPFISGGRVELYQRTSPVTVKSVGMLTTDYGYWQISNSEYWVTWHEKAVEFTIADGNGGTATEVIEFKDEKDS